MKTDRMTFMEVENAALNLQNIESALGREIPEGLLDATTLGDHRMTYMEVENAALNLSLILDAKNRKGTLGRKSLFVIRVLFVIAAIIVAYGFGCVVYAFFAECVF